MGVPRPVVDWMMNLLGTRKMTSKLGGYVCSRTVSTGTLQGGMTSPLDRNLVADGLLWLLNGGGCHDQAFADDFAAVRVSNDLNAAVNLMQCMLKKVTRRRSGISMWLSGYVEGPLERGLGAKTKNGSVALQGRAGAKGRICLSGLVAQDTANIGF